MKERGKCSDTDEAKSEKMKQKKGREQHRGNERRTIKVKRKHSTTRGVEIRNKIENEEKTFERDTWGRRAVGK